MSAGDDSGPVSRAAERGAKICRVWSFQDGRPGHQNQVAGLLEALDRLVSLQVEYREPFGFFASLFRLLGAGTDDDCPDLVIGAGHATHLSVLAAARACRARSVILMKPSFPLNWFDLCFVPEHDRVKAGAHCVLTRGVFNRIRYRPRPGLDAAQTGLLLLGGESRHYRWDNTVVAAQVEEIVSADARPWIVATSRRTPQNFTLSLPPGVDRRVRFVAAAQTDSDWLPAQLETCNPVWVTEDSVSMVYEALSSGAACGLLRVSAKPARPDNKIAVGLERLVADRLILPFARWQQGEALQPPREAFNEAERCARIIYQRWLKKD